MFPETLVCSGHEDGRTTPSKGRVPAACCRPNPARATLHILVEHLHGRPYALASTLGQSLLCSWSASSL